MIASTPSRRALVTGGAGFIGSHLTDILLARGDSVTVVDNLSTGRRSNLPPSHPNLRFIEADLGHALAAFGPREGFDEIYHLAAAVGVSLVIKDPIGSIETNIEQTAALLRFAASRPDASTTRTLLASSSEVYGKSAKSPFSEDDDSLFGPTTVTRWSYACSKAIDEHLGLAYHAQHGLLVTVARFFNTVGPRQIGEYGMVLPRFVNAAINNLPLDVHGDGSQSRCFCDVRDVASILPRMLTTPGCAGRVFNVGAETPIRIADLARLVISTLGSRSTVRFIPHAEVYGAGFEDLAQRRPDLARIREATGFAPSREIVQTIRDLADSLRPSSERSASSPAHQSAARHSV